MVNLDLDNISVDFNTDKIISLYNGVYYNIPFISNLTALKAEFETYFNVIVDRAVVQLKEAQYGVGAEPRIVAVKNVDNRDESQIVNLTIIATEQPTFYAALQATRAEIEAEITAQIG